MLDLLRNLLAPRDPRAALARAAARRVRIHSLACEPRDSDHPEFYRLAFEFTDPPGPYSMQFIEFAAEHADDLRALKPDSAIDYLETRDGARARAIRLPDSRLLLARR